MSIPEPPRGDTDWMDWADQEDIIARNGANVRAYGALGNGSHDDTAAFAAARLASDYVLLPPGNYIYNGTGLEGNNLKLQGAGKDTTTVTLGSGKALVVCAGNVINMKVCDIATVGGFGAIRFTQTAVSVHAQLVVEDCAFWNYTGVAVSSLSQDQPYWQITRNEFYALNDTSATMGVCLVGDNAGSVISYNAFNNNRIHVKLGDNTYSSGGTATTVIRNDFIRFTAGAATARHDLWIVPPTFDTNTGFVCSDNKFGSENLWGADTRVLYADEDVTSGADSSTRLPKLSASTGLMRGHLYRGNAQQSNDDCRAPFITSWTNDVGGESVRDHVVVGTPPTHILYFGAPPTVSTAGGDTSVIGPLVTNSVGVIASPQTTSPCNVEGYVHVIDTSGQIQAPASPMAISGGASLTGFVELCSTPLGSWGTVGTASFAALTDAVGVTDARTVSMPASYDLAYSALNTATLGVPVYIEFDLKAAATSAATAVMMCLGFNGTETWRRQVPIGATWRRWRFVTTPMSTINQVILKLPGTNTGNVGIGRVRVYHGYEPTALDFRVITSTTANRPTSVPVGKQHYDTTLGLPIWWNGTVWKNAAGTTV